MRLGIALCLIAGMAQGQEYVTAKGKLSDDDFYRLVACAAPPGGACQKPFVRWSQRDARNLSVGIIRVDDAYPARLQAKIDGTLDQTLSDLNTAGANLRLGRAASGSTPDIRILMLDLPRNATISGSGLPWLDGNTIGVARAQMGWRDDATLIECAVAISRDAKLGEITRILIEEITQCLGLTTDIGGSYYERRSIFSETSNSTVRLGQQDIMALRRHYP